MWACWYAAGEVSGSSASGWRDLTSREAPEAQEMSDSADTLRNDFEARCRANTPTPGAAPAAFYGAQEDIAKVIEAYERGGRSYPNTEIAAYCGVRLAGFYQYLGRSDEALAKLTEVASFCENTPYAPKASMELGLHYLQVRNDPLTAIEWLSKIPKPLSEKILTQDQYGEPESLYLSAQEQIAKCELMIGRYEAARNRYDLLEEQYPVYGQSIRSEWESESEITPGPYGEAASSAIEQGTAEMDRFLVLAHSDTAGAGSKQAAKSADATSGIRAGTEAASAKRWTTAAGSVLLVLGIACCVVNRVSGLKSRRKGGA